MKLVRIREDLHCPPIKILAKQRGFWRPNPSRVIMSDITALSSSLGNIGDLKVFAPESPCPFKLSAGLQLKAFASFNTAFQQATGWELLIRETAQSYRFRRRAGEVDMPAIPELVITDLSPLLPPGIPAISRIYSEKLVVELNEILSDFGENRRKKFSDEAAASKKRPLNLATAAEVEESIEPLDPNLPFVTSNFALASLHLETQRASCEWFMDESGIARFAAMVCPDNGKSWGRELLAARTTFLAECRHGSSNRAARAAMEQSIQRLFAAETEVDILTGTLNPLTGDITMVGSDDYQVLSSGFHAPSSRSRTDIATFHLPRGQHMLLIRWPNSIDSEALVNWGQQMIGKLQGRDSRQVTSIFMDYLANCLPSLPQKPELSLSVSRS